MNIQFYITIFKLILFQTACYHIYNLDHLVSTLHGSCMMFKEWNIQIFIPRLPTPQNSFWHIWCLWKRLNLHWNLNKVEGLNCLLRGWMKQNEAQMQFSLIYWFHKHSQFKIQIIKINYRISSLHNFIWWQSFLLQEELNLNDKQNCDIFCTHTHTHVGQVQ